MKVDVNEIVVIYDSADVLFTIIETTQRRRSDAEIYLFRGDRVLTFPILDNNTGTVYRLAESLVHVLFLILWDLERRLYEDLALDVGIEWRVSHQSK